MTMSSRQPIRILTAVPICDGHDSAITTINLELIRAGVEVIYLGYHRTVREIVRAAIQEDVRGVGISSYNGGHVEVFSDVVKQLRRPGADDTRVFGGGGGTISEADAQVMRKRGVDRVFPSGLPLSAAVEYVKQRFASAPLSREAVKPGTDRWIAKLMSGSVNTKALGRNGSPRPF